MNKPMTGRVYSLCGHQSRKQAGRGALKAAPDRAPPGSLARRFDGSRHGGVGLALQPRLISPQKDDGRDDHPDPDDGEHQIDAPGKSQQLLAEPVGAHTVKRRPDDAARSVEDEEEAPVHAVDTGQKRGKDAQYGNESPEEHHLGPVLVEQVLAKPEPILLQPDVATVPSQQSVAAGSADQVADVVPDDRARRRGHDDPEDREPTRRSGVNRGGDQHRLTRNRYADALDADEDEQ